MNRDYTIYYNQFLNQVQKYINGGKTGQGQRSIHMFTVVNPIYGGTFKRSHKEKAIYIFSDTIYRSSVQKIIRVYPEDIILEDFYLILHS